MSACARFHRGGTARRNTGRYLDCGRCCGRRWSASCGVRRYLGSARGSTTRRFECVRGRGLARRWTARPGRRRSRPGARSKRKCARRRGGMAGGRARSSRRCAGYIGGTAPTSRRASSRASKVCSSPRGRTSVRCRGWRCAAPAIAAPWRCAGAAETGPKWRGAAGAACARRRAPAHVLSAWDNGKLAAVRLVSSCSVPALYVYRTPRSEVLRTSVHRPQGGFARAQGAQGRPRP